MPPAIPTDLHWLGDRERADPSQHAEDTRGCVMYFKTQDECVQFMRWLTMFKQAKSLGHC